jgi:hypothetical protein
VLLDFNGLSWPHVSVATLRKKAGTTSIAKDVAKLSVPGANRTRETDLS